MSQYKDSDRSTMQVRIYSPEGEVYRHCAYACQVQAVDGGLTILPNHAAILVPLVISAVKVTRCQEDEPVDYIAISGGVLEVRNNVCEIISNAAIRARDIDESSAEIERQRAQEEMQNALSNDDMMAFRRAKIALQRAVNMISVSKNRRQ